MPASENKKLMQHTFFELSKGNSRPFAESMADDFSWTITGTTKWSKKYDGKQAVTETNYSALCAPGLSPQSLWKPTASSLTRIMWLWKRGVGTPRKMECPTTTSIVMSSTLLTENSRK